MDKQLDLNYTRTCLSCSCYSTCSIRKEYELPSSTYQRCDEYKSHGEKESSK